MPDSLIIVAAVLILLVFAILIIIFFWKFSRGLWHLGERALSVFGRTAQIRIVGLGIVTWLFPRAVAGAFFVVFNPIYTFVLQLSSIFSEIVAIFETTPSTRLRMVSTLTSDLANVFARSLATIASFNIPEFVIALMVWVVVGQILDAIWTDDGQQNRLFRLLRSMPEARRQNLYLVVLLLFGTYLSIAAIASIPWLRETDTPIETDSTRLASRLSEIRLSDQEFSKRFSDPPAELKGFREMEIFISKTFGEPTGSLTPSEADTTNQSTVAVVKSSATEKAATDKNALPSQKLPRASGDVPNAAVTSTDVTLPGGSTRISDETVNVERHNVRQTVGDLLSRAQTDRAERIRQWHDLLQRSRQQEDKLQKTVLSTFQENSVGRKGSQERALYFSELDDWYRENVTSLDDRLSACLNAISFNDEQWTRTSQLIESWAANRLDAIRMARQNNFLLGPDNSPELFLEGAQTTDILSCSLPTFEENLPQPPIPGASWGPFGLVASWLLKTESLQLALITGMLGFGLLGSAVSSFVQEGRTRAPGGPLVSDLPALLIRGFSAAIVVFLAAEGGLAIFSGSGTVDPNPYILMFTCFGAAVFSQAAWERVRDKLGEGHEDEQKNGGNAGNKTSTPETPAAQATPATQAEIATNESVVSDPGTDSTAGTKKEDSVDEEDDK